MAEDPAGEGKLQSEPKAGEEIHLAEKGMFHQEGEAGLGQ